MEHAAVSDASSALDCCLPRSCLPVREEAGHLDIEQLQVGHRQHRSSSGRRLERRVAPFPRHLGIRVHEPCYLSHYLLPAEKCSAQGGARASFPRHRAERIPYVELVKHKLGSVHVHGQAGDGLREHANRPRVALRRRLVDARFAHPPRKLADFGVVVDKLGEPEYLACRRCIAVGAGDAGEDPRCRIGGGGETESERHGRRKSTMCFVVVASTRHLPVRGPQPYSRGLTHITKLGRAEEVGGATISAPPVPALVHTYICT